jgi:hypothetical protein
VKEVKKIIIIIRRERERTKNKRRKIDSIKRDCFTAAFRLLVKANLIAIPNVVVFFFAIFVFWRGGNISVYLCACVNSGGATRKGGRV